MSKERSSQFYEHVISQRREGLEDHSIRRVKGVKLRDSDRRQDRQGRGRGRRQARRRATQALQEG
jgi:hypothetical protein